MVEGINEAGLKTAYSFNLFFSKSKLALAAFHTALNPLSAHGGFLLSRFKRPLDRLVASLKAWNSVFVFIGYKVDLLLILLAQ